MSERAVTNPLILYTVFHLNLAYSSIEENQRADVIHRCYWPLLRLIEGMGVSVAIEAPAYTLELIDTIDRSWIEKLVALKKSGLCEFVGSGYSQIIGPLVPADVNAANLMIGQTRYRAIIGTQPNIAFVNEQAFSHGLLEHYVQAGFRALIMEWENPRRSHPYWQDECKYQPQKLISETGMPITLLWNHSVSFQRFQRYVHGEASLDQHLTYLYGHRSDHARVLSLYGSDIETIGFRPGRYASEGPMHNDEWERVRCLLSVLCQDKRFSVKVPSEVIRCFEWLNNPSEIDADVGALQSAADPIPVKKQPKYNVTRWATSGRADLELNTACFRLWKRLKAIGEQDSSCEEPPWLGKNTQAWQELCYLWSSDFRTHITLSRWSSVRNRLRALSLVDDSDSKTVKRNMCENTGSQQATHRTNPGEALETAHVEHSASLLKLHHGDVEIWLNRRRGLAIDALWFGDREGPPFCATLPHGYFDDIDLANDYYTGHTVFERAGASKIADLDPTIERVERHRDTTEIHATIPNELGQLSKAITLCAASSSLTISYQAQWNRLPRGAFRLGYVTLHPQRFCSQSLFYATHNGGRKLERFPIGPAAFDHGRPVSLLVSASTALGLTEGFILVGDDKCAIRIDVDKTQSALVGMVRYHPVGNTYLMRVYFSAYESDDTSQHEDSPAKLSAKITIRSVCL